MNVKKILVVDEPGFAKICCAILQMNGFEAEFCSDAEAVEGRVKSSGCELVITSYPYGANCVSQIKERGLPVLVLADCLSGELMDSIRSVGKYCCLVKPLDFDRFATIVGRMLGEPERLAGGYSRA